MRLAGLTVHFKVWDVNDPFDQLHGPGTGDEIVGVELVDGDQDGPDNRGSDLAPRTYPPVLTNENGEAMVLVTVSLQPAASGLAAGFSIQPARRDDLCALRLQGFVQAPKTGPYWFLVRSDDGSRLWIGAELVVDNDGLHSSLELSGVIAWEAGLHAIRVDVFERTGGAELVVSWEAPGRTRQQIRPEALCRRP